MIKVVHRSPWFIALILGVGPFAAACDTGASTGTASSSYRSGAAMQTAVTSPAVTTSGPPIAVTSPPPAALRPAGGVALPNPRLTPGESFPGVTASKVCVSGYSSSVRNVASAQYREVYAEYGIAYPEPSGAYELDHLISLELGGDNANANLWPEAASPTPGFHQKDQLENAMHSLVCSGRLDLGQAQREIASNWWAAYLRYVGG